MQRGYQNLSGRQFGKLTVSDRSEIRGRNRYWMCACACGETRWARSHHLLANATIGCRKCQMSKVRLAQRPGQSRHPLCKIWLHMIDRCTNARAHNYRWYGATGISVCARWLESFDAFVEDVSPRPSMAHTLDRYPNKHGNYEPGNVRWALKREQANNARNNLIYTIDGRQLTLKQWARERDVNYHSLYNRVVTRKLDIAESISKLASIGRRFA